MEQSEEKTIKIVQNPDSIVAQNETGNDIYDYMITEDSLFPCPCCGGAAIFIADNVAVLGKDLVGIICLECGLRTPLSTSKKSVVDIWNHRPDNGVAVKVENRKDSV